MARGSGWLVRVRFELVAHGQKQGKRPLQALTIGALQSTHTKHTRVGTLGSSTKLHEWLRIIANAARLYHRRDGKSTSFHELRILPI